ncbi:MAG: hypothetical protein F4X23_13285, partial [Gemmatimonadales bacterium]|nr:hypothetical protein [Gemmatimonadales bacterium]
MRQFDPTSLKRAAVAFGAALGALGVAGPAGAQENGSGDVTFNRDVVPILQANCQECHQEGSIAPMSLLTYRDAYRWASG